jgi:hypothetical protein
VNKLKRRPKDIAFDARVENLFYIKMNRVGLFHSLHLSEILLFSQLDGLISFKIQLYSSLKMFNQVLG